MVRLMGPFVPIDKMQMKPRLMMAVSRPHQLLGEVHKGSYYLTSGELKGSRNCLRLMRNERRKMKVMKRSRKLEERSLHAWMR